MIYTRGGDTVLISNLQSAVQWTTGKFIQHEIFVIFMPHKNVEKNNTMYHLYLFEH